mmetsp:Transcript_36426/g.83691  ORF Transcript_36426/g.83691 Transcript_36426/m.83691 type:complete len:214 (+) Transcript_36426:52-693(+)
MESSKQSSYGHQGHSKEFEEVLQMGDRKTANGRQPPILAGVSNDRPVNRGPRHATFNLDEGVDSVGGLRHMDATSGEPQPPGDGPDSEQTSKGNTRSRSAAKQMPPGVEAAGNTAAKSAPAGISEETTLSSFSNMGPHASGYDSTASWQDLDMRIASTLARGQVPLASVNSGSNESLTEAPGWQRTFPGPKHSLHLTASAGELSTRSEQHAVL